MNRFENIETAVVTPVTSRDSTRYLEYVAKRDKLIFKLTKAKTARRKAKIRAELEQFTHDFGEIIETRGEV